MNQPTVIHQTIDDETVIIHLERGLYYSLDETGAAVWQAVAAGRSAREVSDRLADRYPGQRGEIETAVQTLVERLRNEELIVPSDGAPPAETVPAVGGGDAAATSGAAAAASPATFVAPRLERFDDLQDLLLLDPIHAVDEAGWPERIERS